MSGRKANGCAAPGEKNKPGKRIKRKEYIYDAKNGRVIRQIDFETGSIHRYTYNERGRIMYVLIEFPCGVASYIYSYGKDGLLTKWSKFGAPERDVSFQYIYFPGYGK